MSEELSQDGLGGQDLDTAKQETTTRQYSELLKKYRNAESDRKSYAKETAAIIKKQRTLVNKYKKENFQLQEKISMLNNPNMQMMTTDTNFDAPVGGSEWDGQKKQWEEKIKELDNNIFIFRKKIVEQKRSLGGVNAGQESQNQLNKQIKILENRLDKANQKFNEAIAINKNLRQQIDSLRRERVIFDNLYKKLEKDLHEKRKKMADVIESANSAYEERDKANDQIQNLKSQAKREASQFENDLKDLSQLMEKHKKKLYFVRIQKNKNVEDTKKNEDLDKEEGVMQGSVNIFSDQNAGQVDRETLQKFEEDFAKIQASTQVNSCQELVKIFKQREERNFDLFKYVNELSNEIELLDRQIFELQQQKTQYEGKGTDVDIGRKKQLKELEEKLKKSGNQSEKFEYDYNEALHTISNLTNWVETLFHTLECDKTIAQEQSGGQGVTESNLMTFLGIIEERVNLILLHYYRVVKANKDAKNLLNEDKYTQLANQAKVTKGDGELPDIFGEEFEDDENEGEKILSEEEFKNLAIAKIEMRINELKGQGSFGKGKRMPEF